MKKTEEVVELDGRSIPISNLQKPMWKKEGITKADMIQYYLSVAPRMLPFIKERPLMLNRFPHGIDEKSFVQKDWPHHPNWVRTVPVKSKDQPGKAVRHAICNDSATLVWLADMACVEINQFLATSPKIDMHDIVLVDLDPYPPAEFEDLLEIADAIHSALDQMKLRHLIKTSGADGIHMFIPIIPKYEIEVIRKFVLLLGSLLENLLPKKVSTSRHHADRVGKVYIDWFQNGLVKTVAAPFSLRPNRGAPVSFPLRPNDLKKRFRPEDYNIETATSLLAKAPEFDMTPDQGLESAFEELGAPQAGAY